MNGIYPTVDVKKVSEEKKTELPAAFGPEFSD
jgi:hypothetical protein